MPHHLLKCQLSKEERINDMTNQSTVNQLMEIALRIREMREILGYSKQKMADLT